MKNGNGTNATPLAGNTDLLPHLPHIVTWDGFRLKVSANGIVSRWRRGPADTLSPPDAEVAICRKFFDSVPINARIKGFNHGSYGLKHLIEDEAHAYICNGAAIVAAYLAGFRIQADSCGLNASFGIAKAWMRRRKQQKEIEMASKKNAIDDAW